MRAATNKRNRWGRHNRGTPLTNLGVVKKSREHGKQGVLTMQCNNERTANGTEGKGEQGNTVDRFRRC